jgi:hypothetical protein
MYQAVGNKIKYLDFIARSLSPSEQRWKSSKPELAAVFYAFKFFVNGFMEEDFILFVDNHDILFLHSSQSKLNQMVGNYYDKTFEMGFNITFLAALAISSWMVNTLSCIFCPYMLVESGD